MKLKKKTALLCVAVLVGSSLAGCEKTVTVEKNSNVDSSSAKAMGRYLEDEITLPEGVQEIKEIKFLDSGVLRVIYMDGDYQCCMIDSVDHGKNWSEKKWLADFIGVDDSRYFLSAPCVADDGGIFVTVSPDDEADTSGLRLFYISPEGTGRELSRPEGFLSDWVYNSCFTDKGNLLVDDIGNGVIELNPSDGTLVRRYEEGNHVEYIGCTGRYLFTIQNGNVHCYDLENGKPMENMEPLLDQMGSDKENLSFTSTNSLPMLMLKGDEPDSIFYADHTGVYRYTIGGNVVEQVIDGSFNSLGSPYIGMRSWQMDEKGVFYLAANGEESPKILTYTYSKDTPSTPDTELTVYTLAEDDFLKQAAVLFQKKYPDIYLNIESGMTGEDPVTSTDALKVLNTEIMAGKGPDILFMDGISQKTYIEKGILADLSEILEDVEILPNIRTAYTTEDDHIYTMPVKFGIPLLMGEKTMIDTIVDLKTKADAVQANQDAYGIGRYFSDLCQSPSVLLETTADINLPAWLDEKGMLKEDAVKEYLKQTDRIYQAQKDALKETIERYGLSEDDFWNSSQAVWTGDFDISGYALSVLAGTATAAEGNLFSPRSFSMIDSVIAQDDSLGYKLLNGQSENCFCPRNIVGINAKTSEKDAAEIFVRFLFEEEIQRSSSGDGIAVNQKVYEDMDYWKMGKNTGDVLSTVGGSYDIMGDGNILQVEIDQKIPSEDNIKKLIELGKTLTVPENGNRIIKNAVTKYGLQYLKGESELEETVKAVLQEVNLYLAE